MISGPYYHGLAPVATGQMPLRGITQAAARRTMVEHITEPRP